MRFLKRNRNLTFFFAVVLASAAAVPLFLVPNKSNTTTQYPPKINSFTATPNPATYDPANGTVSFMLNWNIDNMGQYSTTTPTVSDGDRKINVYDASENPVAGCYWLKSVNTTDDLGNQSSFGPYFSCPISMSPAVDGFYGYHLVATNNIVEGKSGSGLSDDQYVYVMVYHDNTSGSSCGIDGVRNLTATLATSTEVTIGRVKAKINNTNAELGCYFYAASDRPSIFDFPDSYYSVGPSDLLANGGLMTTQIVGVNIDMSHVAHLLVGMYCTSGGGDYCSTIGSIPVAVTSTPPLLSASFSASSKVLADSTSTSVNTQVSEPFYVRNVGPVGSRLNWTCSLPPDYVKPDALTVDLSQCGSSAGLSGGASDFQPISISLSPTSVNLYGGNTQQFTANVNDNQGVTWSATGGTINSSGLYTSPNVTSQQTYTVTVTSNADSSKSATAGVTVSPAISVSISPVSVTLTTDNKQQYTAIVTNDASGQGVTWSASGGTVYGWPSPTSTSGWWIAPGTATQTGTYTVTVTSVADPSKSATASVTATVTPGTSTGIPVGVGSGACTGGNCQACYDEGSCLDAGCYWISDAPSGGPPCVPGGE